VGTHQGRYRYQEEQQDREEKIQEIQEDLYLEEGKVVERVVARPIVVEGTAE